MTFDEVFYLKDAGIQYHRSGIGLTNKGGNDLYDRIFCNINDNKFKNYIPTFYGKLISRYHIDDSTDELFDLDYNDVLKDNETVSFSKTAFEQKEKILWRQTAPTILAILDTDKRWFRNTIQCAWLKDSYKNNVNIYYALGVFNSKYIDYLYRQKVLETGRVFPQVKIKYLLSLPFIIGSKGQQAKISNLVKKIIFLTQDLIKRDKNSDKWHSIKKEIGKIDKEIDQKVYELYGLTEEEIKIIKDS